MKIGQLSENESLSTVENEDHQIVKEGGGLLEEIYLKRIPKGTNSHTSQDAGRMAKPTIHNASYSHG